MVDFGQAMLGLMFVTNPIKDMVTGVFILFAVGELHAIIRKDRMDAIRQNGNEIVQELSCSHLACPLVPFYVNKLGHAVDYVDYNEEAQLSLACAHFGYVNVDVSNRVVPQYRPVNSPCVTTFENNKKILG